MTEPRHPEPGGIDEHENLTPQQEIAFRILSWQRGFPVGPYTLELYPTLRCNLSCSFCDTSIRHHAASDELPYERYQRLVGEAADLGVRRCYVLGGGEPMVARGTTPRLLESLKSKGIYGILGTNGTLLRDDDLGLLVRIRWDEVHFSLDGATSRVNDELRGQAGAFARVTSVMRRLVELKRSSSSLLPRLVLHTVVTNRNYEQLEHIVELAYNLGCFRVNFDALVAYRPEQHRLKLDDEARGRLSAVVLRALSAAQSRNIETTLEQFLDERTLSRGDMTFDPSLKGGILTAPCLNPWHHLVIHHNGEVAPCCVIPHGIGQDSVRSRDLAEVWFNGTSFQKWRNSIVDSGLVSHCRNCSMSIIGQNDHIRKCFASSCLE